MPGMIDGDFSFFAKVADRCILKYAAALKHFNDGFEAAIKLENGMPLFLDTNVLLRTYSSSFVDREKLKRFFTENKDRIFITNQVQIEYMNNRESVIDEFHSNITDKIQDNFKSDIVNKVTHYYNTNKLILADYPTVHKKIEKINKEVMSIYDEMKKAIIASPQANKDIKFVDDILDIYIQFTYTEKLENNEISFIKNEFDTHKNGFTSENIVKQLGKVGVAFPGIADIKDKPDDPYGDFIIFHEVLKYVKTNNVDAIFLTYDTTKGDWMQFNGEPHTHYIVNTYLNTEKTIYILDAKRVLQGLLEISPTSLTEIVEDEKQKILADWGTSLSKPIFNQWLSKLDFEPKADRMKLLRQYIRNLGEASPDDVWTLSVEDYLNKLSSEAKSKALKDAIDKISEKKDSEKDDPETN